MGFASSSKVIYYYVRFFLRRGNSICYCYYGSFFRKFKNKTHATIKKRKFI